MMILTHRQILAQLAALAWAVPLACAAQGASLQAVVDLRINSTDADLASVAWIRVSRSGDIIVGQLDDDNVKYFTPSGHVIGTFGRTGAGPGEFTDLRHSGWLGDTLWIWDFRQRRLTFITPQRRLARTVRSPNELTRGDGKPLKNTVIEGVYPEAVYPDGSFLAAVLMQGPSLDPRDRGQVHPGDADPDIRMSLDGAFQQFIAWEPSTNQVVAVDGGGFTVPYSPETETDVAPDGSRLAIAWVPEEHAPHPMYRVMVTGSGGATIFARDYPFDPDRISNRMADSIIEYRVAHSHSAQGAAAYRQMHLPPYFPPIDGVVVGRDGTIWLERHFDGVTHRWQELDPRGNPIGTLDFPANVSLEAAQRDRVWALEDDTSGAQGIVRYRVVEHQ